MIERTLALLHSSSNELVIYVVSWHSWICARVLYARRRFARKSSAVAKYVCGSAGWWVVAAGQG